MEMAKTVAAAQNQTFTVPDYEGWVQFAHLLDGYSICDDMGIAFQDWFRDTGAVYDANPDQLSVLDLRMLLFFHARSLRFSMGIEPFAFINTLMKQIAEKADQPYTPLTEDEIQQRIKREEAILMQGFNVKKPDDDASDPST